MIDSASQREPVHMYQVVLIIGSERIAVHRAMNLKSPRPFFATSTRSATLNQILSAFFVFSKILPRVHTEAMALSVLA